MNEPKAKLDKMWFEQKEPKDIAGALKENTQQVMEDNNDRDEMWRRYYRQYRDPKMASVALSAFPTQLSRPLLNMFRTPLTLNIAQSIPDAFLSKIGKYRERMQFTVQNSRRTAAREQARLLQQYDVGIKHQCGMYDTVSPAVKLDSMVFGTGYYNTFWKDGKPCHEHVPAPTVLVDPVEGMNRAPRNMTRLLFIDRRVLINKYPKAKKEIEGLGEGMDGGQDLWWRERFEGKGDIVMVTQAVHLPSGKGADDGRISTTCGDVHLDTQEWKRDWHPITPLRFIEPPDGWDGIGIVEKVSGIQYEINRMVRAMQSAHTMLSHPFIFVEKTSSVNPAHLRGISGTVLSYLKNKPTIEVPKVVHEELYKHMIWLLGYSFETVGLPEADSAGRPHPGMESARAELVAGEKTSDRFTMYQRQGQRAMKELTEKQFDLCAEHNYRVKSIHRSQLKSLSWKEIGVSLDEFIIRPMPASIMPDTPDGQIARIEQLRNSGLVTDLDDQYELLDEYPDMSEFMDRQLSMRRYLTKVVGELLDGAEFEPPVPEIDTKQAMVVGTQMFMDAYADGVEDQHLQKVTMWLDYVRQLEKKRNPPPPPMLPGTAPGMGEQEMMRQAQAAGQMGEMVGAPPPGMLPPAGVPVMTPEATGAVPPPPGENQIAQAMAALPPGALPNA